MCVFRKVEINNSLESIRQKKVLDKLVDNVKASSTIISETETISDYFLELLAVKSEEKILFYLLRVLHNIELDATVIMESSDNELKQVWCL